MLRAKLTPRARNDIERVHDWWRQHRPDAPELVIDEIDAALALLGRGPRL